MKVNVTTLFAHALPRALVKKELVLSLSKEPVLSLSKDFLVCAFFAIMLANLWIAIGFEGKL